MIFWLISLVCCHVMQINYCCCSVVCLCSNSLIEVSFAIEFVGEYSFEKILENRMAYMKRYGKIYKEKLGPMWMVHLFDPTDLATMFRLEGRYPSRGKIAGIEVSYLQRNNKLVGFAFRSVTPIDDVRQYSVILGDLLQLGYVTLR